MFVSVSQMFHCGLEQELFVASFRPYKMEIKT